MDANPLLALLCDSARGRFPGRQDRLVILPPPQGRAMAIVGLPGRHIIASSAAAGWIADHLPADDLMAPLSPRFIAQLGAEIDRCDDGVDVLLAAPGLGGRPELVEIEAADHPRAVRARAHRDEARAFTDASGAATVILGRGLDHRLEVAVEVAPGARNRGLASRVLHDARRLVGSADVLFAQAAAANAASIRALLNAGYTPIGAEVLFFAGPRAMT